MKRYNNFLIVGIDHGYGNIKTANTVTPTGITKLDAAPTFTKNTLYYDGSYYLISEGCGCPVDTSAKQKHRPRRQPRLSKLGDKYIVKGINYELTKIWRGHEERDLAEDTARAERQTADRTQERGVGILLTGKTSQRGGKIETEIQQSAFITGSAGGIRAGENFDTNTDTSAGDRQHQGEGTSTVRSLGSEHSERQSGRESSSDSLVINRFMDGVILMPSFFIILMFG